MQAITRNLTHRPQNPTDAGSAEYKPLEGFHPLLKSLSTSLSLCP